MSEGNQRWRPSANIGVLRQRAAALAAARKFFAAHRVMEAETPVLVEHPVSEPQLSNVRCSLSGRPGIPYYLHTSPEYHMKRLLAAGAPDIYQVAKVFRDDEFGPRHLPEFTLIEWYRRDIRLEELIAETCDLVMTISRVLGRTLSPSVRHAYRTLFIDLVGIDPLATDPGEMRERAFQLLPQRCDDALARSLGARRNAWLDLLMVEVIEPALQGQGLVVIEGYPAEQAGLARRSPTDPRLSERFEVYLDGIELANGYHELADAVEQRDRFERDRAERRRLGLADTQPDPALLAALESGLPDCCGVALGFDRLLMACLGLQRISEVVSFCVPRDE